MDLTALGFPRVLSEEHREALHRSGISDEAISARGYYTANTKSELRALGFGVTAQALYPALVLPVHAPDGQVRLHQIRPDRPDFDKKGKIRKYLIPAGQQICLDVSPLMRDKLKDPSVPILITEGVKKGDAAATVGLVCIAMLSVTLSSGKNEHGARTKLPDWLEIAWSGDAGKRLVYIVFDSDAATNPKVAWEQVKLGRYLSSKGAEVLYVRLPSSEGKKVGLDDFLAAGGTKEELFALATDQPPIAPDELDGLPEIIVNNRHARDITADAIAALEERNDPPRVFRRDRSLVRMMLTADDKAYIDPLDLNSLRHELTEAANWVTATKDGHLPGWPPKDVAANILGHGNLPKAFPRLGGLSAAPVISPAGTFRTEPGYDPDSGWWITHDMDLKPWDGDGASAAAFVMDELFADFPFESKASAANALALFVLPFVRSIIDGPTPLHFVDAPRSGTGKTLFVKAALFPALGELPPVTPVPDKEEEMAKLLFSLLSQGDQVVMFDNMKGYLGSPSLEAALTSQIFVARILSVSKAPQVLNNAIWALTANNGRLSVDQSRRSVWIRLDSQVEDPGERGGFKHPKLIRWIRENRTLLVAAGIAMATEWVKQGRPESKKRKATYEEYSAIVGGILEVCGITAFLDNDKDLKASASDEDELWRPFYAKWAEIRGYEPTFVTELCKIALENEFLGHVFERAKSDRGRSTAFGRALAARVGVVLGGVAVRKSTVRDGVSRFKLDAVSGQVDFNTTNARDDIPADSLFDDTCVNAGGNVHLSTPQVQNPANALEKVHLTPQEGDGEEEVFE